jgi:hypothetical protein
MRFPNPLMILVRSLLLLATVGVGRMAMGAEPEIWLAPVDPIKRAGWPDAGASDFLDLFPADAPWKTAAGHTQVFEIYPQFLARAPDEMLRTVIEGLKQRQIALAVSYGLMHRPKGEPMHEGYGAELATRDIARLVRLGAEVRYVVADEPLLFGHFYWGEAATPRSIEEVAKDVASTARQFREAFPNVRIGIDDPVMLYKPDEWEPAMREFLEVYQREFGEPMGFVRLECASFQVREWLPRYVAAEKFLRSMGVPIGELVTGDAADKSDAEWVRKAEERYAVWESEGRSTPAQVVFQTWMERPTRILPESESTTLTHLLNGYFRERSVLKLTVTRSAIYGHLTDSSGEALAGRHVALRALPGFKEASVVHRSFLGTVPKEARFAQAGLRIGLEGSRAGLARLTFGPVQYAENELGGQKVVWSFDGESKDWNVHATAPTKVIPAESTEPARLQMNVESGQTVLLNSKIVAATPEREYHADFDVQMEPHSETGYLVVFFFDENKKVIQRLQKPLVSDEPSVVLDLVTDAEGRIRVPWSQIGGARELQISFPGDERYRSVMTLDPAIFGGGVGADE